MCEVAKIFNEEFLQIMKHIRLKLSPKSNSGTSFPGLLSNNAVMYVSAYRLALRWTKLGFHNRYYNETFFQIVLHALILILYFSMYIKGGEGAVKVGGEGGGGKGEGGGLLDGIGPGNKFT